MLFQILINVFGVVVCQTATTIRSNSHRKIANPLASKVISKRRRTTQKEIAQEFGISQQHVSLLLNGQRNNPELLSKIQEYLKKEGII
ncbi:helix-turn-helix domain-containing protein [Candidatus Nomurabacteria bacterium]|nr:helix-turn-helix domain-containing protein [Candidatus Nomurabacteria bacterium]